MVTIRHSYKLNNRKGSEMIEMVILLPMLLFLIFGALSYMLSVYAKIVVVDAAREGARAEALGTNNAEDMVKQVIQKFNLRTSNIQQVQVDTEEENGIQYVSVLVVYKQQSFFPGLPGTVMDRSSTPSNYFRLGAEAIFKKEKVGT